MAGGAQAGAAAAVASCLVPFAIAVDCVGEALVPSSLCGTVGFRPSHGRYSLSGCLTLSPSLDTVAIMARQCSHIKALDAVLAFPATSLVSDAKALALPASDTISTATGAGITPSGFPVAPMAADLGVMSAAGTGIAYSGIIEAPAAASSSITTTTRPVAARPDMLPVAAVPPTDPDIVLPALGGLRIGLLRPSQLFPAMDTAVDAVVTGAVTRLGKAGASLVNVDVPLTLIQEALDVAHTLRAYETPRALAAYLFSHVATAPPAKVPGEGEEAEEASGAEVSADAAATEAPAVPKPLDTVLSVSGLVAAYDGPNWAKEMMAAQLDPDSPGAVSHEIYVRALVVRRPQLQQHLADLMQGAGVDLLAFPTTPVPSVPAVGGLRDDLVEAFGHVQAAGPLLSRATTLVAAAGLPSITVPVGMTRPKAGAVAGTAAAERLPVGMSLVGAAGADSRVLAAGEALQSLQSLLPDPIAMRKWGSGVTTR